MARIPSTQALRALESFARHGTVWQAADELNLTRSAVSHQLRLLERDLGFRLMNRIGTRVELTPQGLAYALDIRRALSMISGSAMRNASRGLSGALTVSCPPGFASSWLCGKVAGFTEACPDIALSVLTPRRLDDVSNPDVDIFITFGLGNLPGMEVELLQHVDFTPLCSPAYLNRFELKGDPATVLSASLLHLGDYEDWETWFRLAGLPEPMAQQGIRFSDMNLVYSAALGGQGVAMGDEFICQDAMQSGQLVRPFDLSVRSARSYFMVIPPEKTGNPAVAAFREWLMESLIGKDAFTDRRL
ncbi:LysR substrate-binding domain-containing protein [Pseudogemmobacter faecipullorum]|uniref:LysR family transcriptional regulator n=1 Tax=Pseudogemmobacter faecipullorum TaxID=2755041 RepID=A0ABS8CP65_9RHOB|nr:LysR substrate-binding domain-containing protein [Pseudogemmobacter faecipullorum]MCB5410983.1 LysR family transcriptional regulator [Pseudogemmobacter faecipullorum]